VDPWEDGKMALIALAATTLYFLPTYVIILRGGKPAEFFVRNLLLGWTVIGWAKLLVSSVRQEPEPDEEEEEPTPEPTPKRRRSERSGEDDEIV
jgi:hypothetical protein